jgi:hypothetical protein
VGPQLKLAPVAALTAAASAVTIANASAPSPHARIATAQTIQLAERGGGVTFIDNPPKARHPYQFSSGDIAIVTRPLYQHGKLTGTLRLACLFTTSSADHCTGTATIPGGTIELAGVSNPQPTTDIAVTGGTGNYAGARGSAISKDRPGSGDVADLTITLLP